MDNQEYQPVAEDQQVVAVETAEIPADAEVTEVTLVEGEVNGDESTDEVQADSEQAESAEAPAEEA